jgi:hypothetical protein
MEQARLARLAGDVLEGRAGDPRRATLERIASTIRWAFSPLSSLSGLHRQL